MKHIKIPAVIIDLRMKKDGRSKNHHTTPTGVSCGSAKKYALQDISNSCKNYISHQWEIFALNETFKNVIIQINGKRY